MPTLTDRQLVLIAAARRYKEVRWRHLGRSFERGVDCGGLPYCAARDLGWTYTDLLSYSRYPDGVALREHFRSQMVLIPRTALQPADVVLLLDVEPSTWPCHIAIVATCAERLTLIHSSALEMRVVENGMDPSWEQKIVGCFRFREIAAEIGPWTETHGPVVNSTGGTGL